MFTMLDVARGYCVEIWPNHCITVIISNSLTSHVGLANLFWIIDEGQGSQFVQCPPNDQH